MDPEEKIRFLSARVELLTEAIDHYRRAARVLGWVFFLQSASLAVNVIEAIYRVRGR